MKTIILLLLLTINSFAFSQITDQKELSSIFVIDPKFEKSGDFSEGLAAALDDGKWGYIDKDGEWIIKPSFGNALGFSEGLALVFDNGKYVYIGISGEKIISKTFLDASSFKNGLAVVDQKGYGEYEFINSIGESVLKPKVDYAQSFSEDLAPFQLGGKWGFIDKKGGIKIKADFKAVRGFSQGLAAIKQSDNWGFCNQSGKLIIKYNYQNAGQFREGLCPVGLDGKWGYIDQKGKEVIPFSYEDATSFSSGFAAVKKDGKWGYIDKTGVFVIAPFLEEAHSYKDGVARVAVSQNGDIKYGYIGLISPNKSSGSSPTSAPTSKPKPDLTTTNNLYKACGELVQGWEGTISNVHTLPKGTKTVQINWNIINEPYEISIYEGKGLQGKRLFRERKLEYTGKYSISIKSRSSFITVRVKTAKDKTEWSYFIDCK